MVCRLVLPRKRISRGIICFRTIFSFTRQRRWVFFQMLKAILHSISGIPPAFWWIVFVHLHEIHSNTFSTPFLDIFRFDEESGPVTCWALNVVNRLLAYGLIGRRIYRDLFATFEFIYRQILEVSQRHRQSLNWPNAVTHIHFLGMNPDDAEVALLRTLQVRRKTCSILSL